MFRTAYYLLRDVGAEAVTSPRAEAVGEQGEHYDPLFAYNEGHEAGYFAVPEESGLTLVLRALGLSKEVL